MTVPQVADGPTRIAEIADGIHRISTSIPPAVFPDGFTFSPFLIATARPLNGTRPVEESHPRPSDLA